MKLFLASTFSILCLSVSAQSSINVIYSFVNGLGETQTVRQISFTPLAINSTGTGIVTTNEVKRVATGTSYTNTMYTGIPYRVKFFSNAYPPIPVSDFTNYFPTTIAAGDTVYATNYMSFGWTFGTFNYGLSAGSNISFQTNGTTLTISSSASGGGATNVATTNSPDLVFSGNGSTASPITASFSTTQSNLLANAVQTGSTNANLSITGNAATASTALDAQYGSQLFSSLHNPNQLPSIALTVQTNFAQVNGTNYDAFPAMDSSPDGNTLYMVYRSAIDHFPSGVPVTERLVVSRDAGASWQFVTNIFSDSTIDWRNINFGVLKTGTHAGRLLCMAWPAIYETSSSNYWGQGVVKASDDNGTNWFQVGTIQTNVQANAYSLSSANMAIAQNGNYLHAPAYSQSQSGSSSICYDLVSTNGGTNWDFNTITNGGTEVEPYMLPIVGTPNVIAITRTTKIYYNTNNGSGTWDYKGQVSVGSYAPPTLGLYPTAHGNDLYLQMGARSGYPMYEYFGRIRLYDFLQNPALLGYNLQTIGLTAQTNTIVDGGYGSFLIGKDGSALSAWYYSTNMQTNATIVLKKTFPSQLAGGTNYNIGTAYFANSLVLGSNYNGSILVNSANPNSALNPNLATGLRFWSDGSTWSSDLFAPGTGSLSTRHVRLVTLTSSGGTITATNVNFDSLDNGNAIVRSNLSAGGIISGNGSGLTNLDGSKIQSGTIPVTAVNATGTPSSTTYWRGDGTWSTPTGGGSNSIASTTDLLKGDNSGGAIASGIQATNVALLNGTNSFSGSNYVTTLTAGSLYSPAFTVGSLFLPFAAAIPYVNATSNLVALTLSSDFALAGGTLSIAPNRFDAYNAAHDATNVLGTAAYQPSSAFVLVSGGTLSSGTISAGTLTGVNNLNGTIVLNAGGEAITVSGGANINVGGPGGFTGDVSGGTNYATTNLTTSFGTLAPSGNATNYTINLRPGEIGNIQQIYLANTNCFITFTGTNVADSMRTVLFRGWTNSVNSSLSFNLIGYHTNSSLTITITNGYSGVFNFYNPDTTGSNVMVSDGGRWK